MAVSAPSAVREPTGSDRVTTPRLDALTRRVLTGEGERETMEIHRPATGDLLATVPRCTPDDVTAAVARAGSSAAVEGDVFR